MRKSFIVRLLCLFYSAAIEAELARQKVHLRGPEELQQATRFLHDNGMENIKINEKHMDLQYRIKTREFGTRKWFELTPQLKVCMHANRETFVIFDHLQGTFELISN